MRRALRGLVLTKANIDRDPGFAQRYRIYGVPTLLFLRPDGTEVDRLIGTVEAEQLPERLAAFRRGGTTPALVRRLELGDGDHRALESALATLEEQGDLPGAITLVEAYHHGHVPRCCRCTLVQLRLRLQDDLYRAACAVLFGRRLTMPAVPAEAGAASLRQMLADALLASQPKPAVASRLRECRRSDAASVLRPVVVDELSSDDADALAELAYQHGVYDDIAPLYRRAFEDPKWARPRFLMWAGWQLYRVRRDLPQALAWARAGNPPMSRNLLAPGCLARLEYLAGDHEAAIALLREVMARGAGADPTEPSHDKEVLAAMLEGRPLPEHAEFEDWPVIARGPRAR